MYELYDVEAQHFPTFGWGLSLRRELNVVYTEVLLEFPHLRVGTFIEALASSSAIARRYGFPHLRVGTFIEAWSQSSQSHLLPNFPTFGWGLSLRPNAHQV